MDNSRSFIEADSPRPSILPCFLRGFLENPLRVASFLPSSNYLQRKLSSLECLQAAQVVVELGPGTGETTRALLNQLPQQSILLCIEVVNEFVNQVRRITDARVIVEKGSALNLRQILKHYQLASPDVIVSGVPFSVMSPEEGHSLIELIYDTLAPGGSFVTYQFRSRVCDLAFEYFGKPKHRSVVIWNLPPLEIFVWQKNTTPHGAVLRNHIDFDFDAIKSSTSLK